MAKIASTQTTYGSQPGNIFAVNDVDSNPILSVANGTNTVSFSGDIIMRDKEQDEEWVLSISKGQLVLTPNCKKSRRRHKLDGLINE